MKIIFLIFFIIFIISIETKSLNFKDLKYINSYSNKLLELNNGLQIDQPIDHSTTFHECQHHKLKIERPLDYQQVSDQNLMLSSSKTSILGQQQQQSHQFRILLNTSYLSGVEPQTCTSVGQTVVIGPPGQQSNGACSASGSGPFPCTWTCAAEDIVSSQFVDVVNNVIMENVLEFFQSILTIDGVEKTNYIGYTKLSQGQLPCSQQYIDVNPNYIQGRNGFNADIVLYVTAHPIPGPTVAYAAPCILDQLSGTNRPMVSFININPNKFSSFVNAANQQGPTWETYHRVVSHETTHALGFSQDLFSDFIDRTTGRKYANGIQTFDTYSGTTPSGVKFTRARQFVSSPTVLDFARKHFACDEIKGAELENVGDSGTVGSHWKGTVFGEEVMIGYAQPSAPYSNLTLALLYDTGWYGLNTANVSTKAEKLIWGSGLGCPFADTCSTSSWKFPNYFPTSPSQYLAPSCTSTRSGKGYTYVSTYTNQFLPFQQHFSNPNVGGGYNFKDYCPYSDVFLTNYNNNNYYCFDPQSPINNNIYEKIGLDSKCFEYTNQGSSSINQACWQQRCNNLGNMEINYNSVWRECVPGRKIDNGDGVTILCPSYYNICNNIQLSNQSTPLSSSSSDSFKIEISTFKNIFNFIILILLNLI